MSDKLDSIIDKLLDHPDESVRTEVQNAIHRIRNLSHNDENEVEYYEFINNQLIFKYPRQWNKIDSEVGMLFVPPDSKLLEDPDSGKSERDLGLFMMLHELAEKRPTGEALDEVTRLMETTHPPYPNFSLRAKQKKSVRGADAAITFNYSYRVGIHEFFGVYIIAEKARLLFTMQLFGTPHRFGSLGQTRDIILDSLWLQ